MTRPAPAAPSAPPRQAVPPGLVTATELDQARELLAERGSIIRAFNQLWQEPRVHPETLMAETAYARRLAEIREWLLVHPLAVQVALYEGVRRDDDPPHPAPPDTCDVCGCELRGGEHDAQLHEAEDAARVADRIESMDQAAYPPGHVPGDVDDPEAVKVFDRALGAELHDVADRDER